MTQDIAERQRQEQALRQSEQQLRNLIDGSIQGILIHDEKGKPLFVNQAFATIYGFDTPEEVLKLESLDHLIPPEDRARILSFRSARLRGEAAPEVYEARRLKRDGTTVWLDNRSKLIEWNGRPVIQAVVVDMTERKQAEDALRASVAALGQANKIAKLGHYTWSAVEKRLLTRSQSYLDILGLSEDPEPGTVGGLASVLHPEDRSRAISESLAAEAEHRGLQLEYRVVRPDGTLAHIRELSEPIPGHQAGAEDWFGTIQDISDIRKAEEELRRSEQRFRTLTDNLPGVVYRRIVAPDGQVRDIYVSPRVKELLGVDVEEFTSGRARLNDFLHPDDREKKLMALHESAESLQPLRIEVRKIVRSSGEVRWWQVHSMPTKLADGSIQFDGIALDITERRATEEQLKQALKMEAIGHLTGGIAHDFNNLLTVILGSADELRERESSGRPRQLLDSIVAATQKASQLTARLLAFARKQPLEPRAVNINRFVSELKPLLQRTLGENIDIEMRLQPDLWNAYVDAHQVEAAVLNLAINARDAMGDGGHLTVDTSNVVIGEEQAARYGDVKPGAYVSLSVSDDGCGMPPDVLDRAIEPFFTTKGIGKGTGLGLSMAHGFAKQSGGHMTIYSEVGIGTTVRLYFQKTAASAPKDEAAVAAPRHIPGGQETILVVEDNPAVRETATDILRGLGYMVLEAADGVQALAVAKDEQKIDLLFTDVIMPGGMTGPTVAKEMRAQRPGLRVLYTSGYTENAFVHQGKLDDGVELLQKPYRRQALAQKIRAVLDR
jgi:PAS domain S-box-containing protein